MATNGKLNRKLRMALVGGGQGSFIGRVHVTAAVLDNRAALVAGALSSDPAKAKASAADYDIPESRAYVSFQELVDSEKKLPADQRIDFVSIATPNHLHFPVAKAALEGGFNVVCDKPMTFNLNEAEQLVELVKKSGCVFALSHNYTANWVRFRPFAQTTSKAGCERVWRVRSKNRRRGGPIPLGLGPRDASETLVPMLTTWLAT